MNNNNIEWVHSIMVYNSICILCIYYLLCITMHCIVSNSNNNKNNKK